MITFTLTFLIAFSIKQTKENVKKAKKEPKATQKDLVIDPNYVIRTDKILGTAHIEYELVPIKCRYQVDVICWGKAAKVFSTDGCRTFKTIYCGDQIWVPICIEHYLPPLEQEEILTLHEHVVEFVVFTDRAKLGNMAKTDKTSVLYMQEDDINTNEFVDLFTEDPNIENVAKRRTESLILERQMREIIMKCVNYPRTSTVSWLYYRETFWEIMQDIIQCGDIPRKYKKPFSMPCAKEELVEMKKDVKFKLNGKKEKGPKEKKKPKKVSMITLRVQAEVFFTDPNIVIFKTENEASEIKQFYVMMSVSKLLTRAQKMFFNPLVVKIKKISNFPDKIAKEAGVIDLFCKYKIPCIANCQTVSQPLDRIVHFNESHVHFTNVASKIKLLEFAQTKRLFIEIYGNKKSRLSNEQPKLFGTKPGDQNLSKISQLPIDCVNETEENKVILLAVASFDISSLTQNIWIFKEKGQLHSPTALSCQKPMGSFPKTEFIDQLNINEINLQIETFKSDYLFTDGQFIAGGSTLKVEVHLLAPQAATLALHQIPNTYKRLFIIFFSEMLARKFYKLVMGHNEAVPGDLLTGFLLDNGNHFAFYIEGLSIGYILNIWNEIHMYEYDFAKLFFNTDSAFERRLYSEFAENGGIYTIALKVPFGQILAQKRIYITGNTPEPCLKAITKFHLLFNSRTLQSILQYELFPKPIELISFNIEFGVARRWNIIIRGSNEPRTSVFLPFRAVQDAELRGIVAREEII